MCATVSGFSRQCWGSNSDPHAKAAVSPALPFIFEVPSAPQNEVLNAQDFPLSNVYVEQSKKWGPPAHFSDSSEELVSDKELGGPRGGDSEVFPSSSSLQVTGQMSCVLLASLKVVLWDEVFRRAP